MLMNNLDPDVAERPSELVVYGGIGRAARDWDSLTGSLPRCASSMATRRWWSVGQAGRNFPHPCRCAARADRELEPGAALGDARSLQRAGQAGLDDVRPDDGRIVDLHRQPGHRAGDL
jgi:hypothetical protein